MLLLGGTYVSVAQPSAQLGASENMIKNPGFEHGEEPGQYLWSSDNWAKNEAEFALDRDQPRSGDFSQRVTMTQVLNYPDLQLAYRTLPVRPGMAVQLRFWMRGPANSTAIKVEFRKGGAPYTTYFMAEVALTDQWSESVFNVVLPGKADPSDTSLRFHLSEPNTFWLDDVSITTLPPKAKGQPLTGNQLANGSFEVGTDRWYAVFRESGRYQNYDIATERNIQAGLTAKASSDAPHGSQVLHFPIYEKCLIKLTSAYFPLRYGYPATVRFHLKTSRPNMKISALLRQGSFPNHIYVGGQKFTSTGTDWQTYSFQAVPQPSIKGTYFLEFVSSSPGEFELDAVSVNEGTVPLTGDEIARENFGWEQVSEDHPANIFHRDEKVAFRILAEVPQTNQPVALRGRVIDAWENVVHEFNTKVELSKDGLGQVTVNLPSDRFGAFKCQLSRAGEKPGDVQGNIPGGDVPDVEVIYHVVPRLAKTGAAPDSFFGGHVLFTPYNLHIAEKAGIRWLRMHPPMGTKWLVVEPRKDEWVFTTDGLARAHEMGFRILGSFADVPPFHADPQRLKENPKGNHAPGDWDAYRDYIVKTATAFAPYIQHWEIWNEPDASNFLHVGPGQSRAGIYMEILKHTRAAVHEAELDVKLVGPAVAQLWRNVIWDVLDRGGADDLDILSFHYYNGMTDPIQQQPPFSDAFERMTRVTNIDGQVPDVWMTEGGAWLRGANPWLKTARVPTTIMTETLDAANALVRMAVGFKASGVKRYFHYIDFAQPSGRLVYRHECQGMIDVNGLPHAAFPAHAAMVYFLEGAKPRGIDRAQVGKINVVQAKFAKGDQTINVVWSSHPIAVSKIKGLKKTDAQAYDMMGNSIDFDANTQLSPCPIYLVTTRTD